ncbi:3-carboxy-cis,cis-muconate cycloisomerase [Arthrobacter sp. MYb224]|uniref:lyase family protein n=1 Tax=Micrococcaceae TaxID=1268 RepID=UPI000CFB5CA4|nr:lyase family protein [Arthrobacter sp. MYb224]PQZ98686.1 3-carboxy-cis,cis-muconate cycloisomerase [Arthrobacter sp. MYb224]
MDGADYGVLSPAWAGTAVAALASDAAFVQAMLDVEAGWVQVQAEAGLCTGQDAQAVRAVSKVERYDLALLASKTPDGANALIPLLGTMRELLHADGAPKSASASLHRGATSQDIIDTALMLVLSKTAGQTLADLRRAAQGLAHLAQANRGTICIARSLTQHALPTTFGWKAASWLSAVLSAEQQLESASKQLSLQWGGAVGTLASLEQFLSSRTGAPATSQQLGTDLARLMGLSDPGTPWHTNRMPIVQIGSALAATIAALGTFGADVLTASRPEIGELSEPREAGKGGSSAMPQKQNPVRSILLRNAAFSSPGLLSTLFTAAGTAVDERPDGGWHSEWNALRELARLASGAAFHGSSLANGLIVNLPAIERNLALGGDAVLSERLATVLAPLVSGGKPAIQALVRRSLEDDISLRELLRLEIPMHDLSDQDLFELLDPAGYLGAADRFTETVLAEYSARKELWQSHN